MYRADVIYNQGEVMCTAYGSNKKQAERNASIMGLLWLENEFKGYASSSGGGGSSNPI